MGACPRLGGPVCPHPSLMSEGSFSTSGTLRAFLPCSSPVHSRAGPLCAPSSAGRQMHTVPHHGTSMEGARPAPGRRCVALPKDAPGVTSPSPAESPSHTEEGSGYSRPILPRGPPVLCPARRGSYQEPGGKVSPSTCDLSARRGTEHRIFWTGCPRVLASPVRCFQLRGLPQVLGMPVTPWRSPVPLQPPRQWLLAAPYPGCAHSQSGGAGCGPRPMLPGGSGRGGSWAKASPQNKIPTWPLPASVGPGLRGWSHLRGGSLGCSGAAPVSSQPSGGAAQLLAGLTPPSCAHSPPSGCRETEAHYMGGEQRAGQSRTPGRSQTLGGEGLWGSHSAPGAVDARRGAVPVDILSAAH